MAGFDPAKAAAEIILPDGYSPLTIFAVGYAAEEANFLPEFLRERHEKQRARVRKELSLVASSATFKQE